MSRLKTVIHIHTNYSFDANMAPDDLVNVARRQGVHCLAITDHDDIGGALDVRRLAPDLRVIVGEEISSADGHIIGLFLRERIAPGLSLEDTATAIRDQGGLVFAPHPCATLCESALGLAELERLRPWVDAVEICNSQNLLVWEERHARAFCDRYGVTPYVGADVHIRGHLAGAYQWIADFEDAPSFLAVLGHAELHPRRFGLSYFAAMGARHVWDMVAPRHLPGFGVNVRPLPQPANAQQLQLGLRPEQ